MKPGFGVEDECGVNVARCLSQDVPVRFKCGAILEDVIPGLELMVADALGLFGRYEAGVVVATEAVSCNHLYDCSVDMSRAFALSVERREFSRGRVRECN